MAGRPSPLSTTLDPREQMVLAGFFAGRLPAGQVHAELLKARAIADAAAGVAAESEPVADRVPARRLRARLAA